jgi:hypothetical protein
MVCLFVIILHSAASGHGMGGDLWSVRYAADFPSLGTSVIARCRHGYAGIHQRSLGMSQI